jgi:mRNA interferase YafQ
VKRSLVETTSFLRAARRIVKRCPELVESMNSTLEKLANDAFDPSLKTHKLKGELAGSWSCSAGYDLRVVFEFIQHEGSEAILLHSVGTHDEVY